MAKNFLSGADGWLSIGDGITLNVKKWTTTIKIPNELSLFSELPNVLDIEADFAFAGETLPPPLPSQQWAKTRRRISMPAGRNILEGC